MTPVNWFLCKSFQPQKPSHIGYWVLLIFFFLHETVPQPGNPEYTVFSWSQWINLQPSVIINWSSKLWFYVATSDGWCNATVICGFGSKLGKTVSASSGIWLCMAVCFIQEIVKDSVKWLWFSFWQERYHDHIVRYCGTGWLTLVILLTVCALLIKPCGDLWFAGMGQNKQTMIEDKISFSQY